MPKGLVANIEATIEAPVTEVWEALVNPVAIKRYFCGADVVTTWMVGSPNGLYRFADVLMAPMVRQNLRADLARLKALVERS